MDTGLFREICDAAPDGILVVDADGRIVTANRQAQQLFGYDNATIVGSPVEMLLPAAARGSHVARRHSYAAHPSTRPMGSGLDLYARRADGVEFPVEISLSPVHAESGPLVISIVRDITERRRLEAEREELRAMAETERERQRIAMDLHDGIIQSIYAVGLTLESAAEDVSKSPHEAEASINRSIDQLSDVIRDLRSYILDLRPARYGGHLAESLQNLAVEFRANTLIDVDLQIATNIPTLSVDQETAIFHVAQESLNNARKHARAAHVGVSLTTDSDDVTLTVHDDGAGFDATSNHSEDHNGLRNMSARARSCHGDIGIETSPGAGPTIRLRMPIHQRAEEPT